MARHEGTSSNRKRTSHRSRVRRSLPWLTTLAMLAGLVVGVAGPAYAADGGSDPNDLSFGELVDGESLTKFLPFRPADGWDLDASDLAFLGTDGKPLTTTPLTLGAFTAELASGGCFSGLCPVSVTFAPTATTADIPAVTLRATYTKSTGGAEDSVDVLIRGTSVAPCGTCSVVASAFYEPYYYAKRDNAANPSDVTGIATDVAKQSITFYNTPSTITMPEAFEAADRFLDRSGPTDAVTPPPLAAWNQSTVPTNNMTAGNYQNLWQVVVVPRQTLHPGNTITVRAPQPFDPYAEDASYTGSGTRFPQPAVRVPSAVAGGDGDVVARPYAIVPGFRGCGEFTTSGPTSQQYFAPPKSPTGQCDYWYPTLFGSGAPLYAHAPNGEFEGHTANNVEVSNNGRVVTVTVPDLGLLEAGTPFTLMIAGVTAPPAGQYQDPSAFNVSTSKDVVPAANGHGVDTLFGYEADATVLKASSDGMEKEIIKPETWELGFGSLGRASSQNSRLTISAASAGVGVEAGDGVDATLYLQDVLHNPIAGMPATILDATTLTSAPDTNAQISTGGSGGDDPTGNFPISNAAGVVKATVRNSTVETVPLVGVTEPDDRVSPRPSDRSELVPCDPGASDCVLPEVDFVAGVPAPPPVSTIVVDKAARPADGLTPAKVTVTLKDKYGNPDLGHRVTLTPADGSMQATVKPVPSSYCIPDNPAKGACTGTEGVERGKVVFNVTANRPGTVRLGVTDLDTLTVFPTETDDQVARITFHGLSTANSTVTPTDSEVPIEACTDVTVVVVDDQPTGVGMQGRLVELTSDSDTATISADTSCPPDAISARATTSTGTDEAANGRVVFKVSNTVPEDVAFTARVITDGVALEQRATVRFNRASSLVASPNVVVADGIQKTALTLTLRAADGSVVPGQCVNVVASIPDPGDAIAPTSPTDATCPATSPVRTDANGQAQFQASRTSPGLVNYNAIAPTTYDVSNARATVRYLAPPTARSTLTSDATELQADGVSAAQVTFTARDSAGNAITGLRVRLAQAEGDHATIRAIGGTAGATEAVTDGSGVARFRVTNHNIEDVTLTAQYLSAKWEPVPEVSLDISFIQPINEAYNSTIEASGPWAYAGGPTVTVTVTLLDADFNPLPRHAVALRSETASVSVQAITEFGISDPDGVAQFAVSSSRAADDVVINAIDLETGVILNDSVTVDFRPVPPTDAAASDISVSPTTLPAGGATSTVVVTLEDAGGLPKQGHRVALSTGSTRTIVSGGQPTDQFGKTTFLVSGTVAETVTLTALDLTDSVTLAEHPTITFTTAPSQANQSSVEVSPASLPAGGPKSTVTVTLKSASGAPLSGHTMRLETGSTTTTVQALTAGGVTDSAGVVKFTVSDSAVESVVIRATDLTNGTLLEDKPTIAFQATEANQSTVVADPANQVIRSSSGITVRLLDAAGAPLAGHTVSLAMSSTIARLDATTMVTGADGVARFTLTGEDPGEVVLTATDQTSGVVLDQTATVTFFKKGRIR